MKEESKKVGLLVNRYGLLAILGLGYSLMGTNAYGSDSTAPTAFPGDFDLQGIRPDTRLFANKATGNDAWIFDQNGNLSEGSRQGNVFRDKQEDSIKILGTGKAGNTVQVVFDRANEPGTDFDVHIKDGVPAAVANGIIVHNTKVGHYDDDLGKNTVGGAFYALYQAAQVASAQKLINVYKAACTDVKASADTNVKPSTTNDAAYDAILAVLDTLKLSTYTANAGLSGDIVSVDDMKKALENVAAAAASAKGSAIGQTNFGGLTLADGATTVPWTDGTSDAGGPALAVLFNTKVTGGITNQQMNDAIKAIQDAIEREKTTSGTHLTVKTAKDALNNFLDNTLNAVTNCTGQLSIHGAACRFEDIRDALKEYKGSWSNFISQMDWILDEDFLGNELFNWVRNFQAGGTWAGVFDNTLADLVNNYEIKAPFVIAPEAADSNAPLRTFILQITQNQLAKLLKIGIKENKRSIFIKTENMRENEKSVVVFDANGENRKPTKLGEISYDKLDKDLSLALLNETKARGSVWGISSVENPTQGYDHLTLQIAKISEGDLAITKTLYLKKLILGASPENPITANLIRGDKREEVSFIGNTDSTIIGQLEMENGSLYLHDGIDVLENFSLRYVMQKLPVYGDDNHPDTVTGSVDPADVSENGDYYLGGDVRILPGVTLTIAGRAIRPLDPDLKPALNGSGDGNVGVFSVAGNLSFEGSLVREPEGVAGAHAPDSKVDFSIENVDGISYHNYIVVTGGSMVQPREIRLNGKTVRLHDTAADSVLDKINTKDSSQFILVKAGSHAKVIGSDDPSGTGTLKLDLHGDNAKRIVLVKLEKGASVLFDPITLDAGLYTAIKADEDGEIRFLDSHEVSLKGDISAGRDLRLTFLLGDPDAAKPATILNWASGTFDIPANEKVHIVLGIEGKDATQMGSKAFQALLDAYKAKNPQLQFIALTGNTSKDDIVKLFSPEGLPKGVTFEMDPASGNVVLDLSNAKVAATIQELLGGKLDTSYLSGKFQKIVNNAYENGVNTSIEAGILNYVQAGEAGALPAFSKTTTEEKNRMTLALINSARETAYSKMGGEFFGDKHYSVWASGFGDTTKNGTSSSYKMDCDIYGFTAGIDWRANNNLLIGALGGGGKAKAKYKGDVHLVNADASKGNLDSYFGGIYGMWDEFIQDICVKFSIMAGHGKYKEHYALPSLTAIATPTVHPDHKGHWISGNIDCTYKHWNLFGFNVGPWVSLSASTIHQKADSVHLDDVPNAHFERKVAAADHYPVEAAIGIAADYDFSSGMLELALGYKHEFRNRRNGEVSLKEIYNTGSYKGATVANGSQVAESFEFDAFNVDTAKNSFVARASWNMKFGNFGLSLGGHTQIGDHFRDLAGSITASYAF
ncbi:MAG: autotransporter outer membrane beta-barrel domain-containing protein [Puniceicoccales bacterium]|jgi:hypothetical protein|nr:autotransporter outer membrane beta-barrel domain-containing protein [Puniceicoccales bacterium]